MEVSFADGVELFFPHGGIWGALCDSDRPGARGFRLPAEPSGIFGDADAADGTANDELSRLAFRIFFQHRAGVLMRRTLLIFGLVAWSVGFAASRAGAHTDPYSEFQKRRVAAGLTEAAVRRMVAQQLYLSRFIDYRFRPEAQVSDEQVEAYYRDEFSPQIKARNETVPSLDDVDDTIREVLIQRAISDRAAKWLSDSRDRLKIDIVARGSGS